MGAVSPCRSTFECRRTGVARPLAGGAGPLGAAVRGPLAALAAGGPPGSGGPRRGRHVALDVLLAVLALFLLVGGVLSPCLTADPGAQPRAVVAEALSAADEHPDEAGTAVRAPRTQRAAESSRAVRHAARAGVHPAPAAPPRGVPVPAGERPGAGLLGLSCVVLRC
ncbi:hypothetical protein ABZ721_38000 [Streptomyces sp. NPDC006733]|uniref:hypothetical protein n=1 Tax=Streptomyces sp. NPDC006733 TaxID=3155460 RepID=UPI0033FD365D